MNFLRMPLLPIFGLMHEDDPPPSELRSGVEEFMGRPGKVTPQQGIAQATEDIKYWQKKRNELNKAINAGADAQVGTEQLVRINQEIRKAQQLLASYQAQLDGRN